MSIRVYAAIGVVLMFVSAMAAVEVLNFGPGGVLAQENKSTQPAAPPKPDNSRNDDRAAIAATLDSFVRAFEARDAKALAAVWTEEGEYFRDPDFTLQGQAAIEEAFEAFFARTPEVTAKIQSKSLRFVGRDTASSEGVVRVRRGPIEPATEARYLALIVREDGKWRLARLEESDNDEPTDVAALDWLIGHWQATAGQDAEIQINYSWAPNKKFINVQFALKEAAMSLAGQQVIGVDPATGSIHSWTFEADGGVGEAEWSRDGDHWVLDAAGTLADGRTLRETNVLRRVNDQTITFQSTERELDGESIDDLPPVKLVRVKSAKP